MFDIGWSEFLFLAVLLLVVVGPRELPGLMRQIGRISATLRNAASQFQHNLSVLDREANLSELGDISDSLSPGRILDKMGEEAEAAMPPPDNTGENAVSAETDGDTRSGGSGGEGHGGKS